MNNLENKIAGEFLYLPNIKKLRGRKIARYMKSIKVDAVEFLERIPLYTLGQLQGLHCHLGMMSFIMCTMKQLKKRGWANTYSVSQLGWRTMREAIFIVCESLKNDTTKDPHQLIGGIPVFSIDNEPSLYVVPKDYIATLKEEHWLEMEEWLKINGFPFKCMKEVSKKDNKTILTCTIYK